MIADALSRISLWLPPARPAPGAHVVRLERVLAVGRAFLTVTGLAAIYLDPEEPAQFAAVAYGVLAGYALYSLMVLAYVHQVRRLGPVHVATLHGLDILWTSVLTFVSQGPLSPFFLFFLFVVLAAAYRWAQAGTLLTTAIVSAVFLLQAGVAAAGPWNDTWIGSVQFEMDRTVLRVAYLLLTGFLLGYLAGQDKQSRAELAAVAEMTRQPRVELGLGGSVAAVARGLLRTFDAQSIHFVLQDHETKEAYLYRLDRTSAEQSMDPPRIELSTGQQEVWLFPDPGRVWVGTRTAGESALRVGVVDPGMWPLRRDHAALPAIVAGEGSYRRVVVANLGLQDEWRGRVYLIDPVLRGSLEEALHFVEALIEHITPALSNVFLLGRLRARVTAAERARVARELHDGAIQALFGVEMKVEALRRGSLAAPIAAELADVQELIRREILALRELMQALRPIGLDSSEQLPDVLANVVERFRRDTGVPARFVFTGKAAAIQPAVALEIVRIVQEALVNVRKHSRARNVMVRLAGTERGYSVVVEDDGVGFEFEGRLSARDLDERRLGPAIIKERARIAGAQLAIDSSPGSGSRIELTLDAT